MKTKKKSKLTRDSSKQIDEHFHRISFREIKILWTVLGNLAATRADFVRARFLQDALHYFDVTDFLKHLGILNLAKGQISGKENLGKTDDEIKYGLVQRLIERNTPYRTHLNEFFRHFENVDGNFEISMDSGKRRQFGGIRNLLLDLEFLEQDSNQPRYWISPQHLTIFIEAKSNSPISPLELQAVLRAREELGQKAELEVLKFEQARLRNNSVLVKRIKHVASENVGAGYDILSFTDSGTKSGFSDRLIEVKAVSPIDFKFYWSRNEIETARIHGGKYFLYLIPVAKIGFDVQKLRIIPNPFESVYSNNNIWLRQEELIAFWPKH
jgi:Protein NO VEIN, C-terminal